MDGFSPQPEHLPSGEQQQQPHPAQRHLNGRGWHRQSFSKPWLLNFRARLFSVMVRTTFSGTPPDTSAKHRGARHGGGTTRRLAQLCQKLAGIGHSPLGKAKLYVER
jgi:hypothetical protein